jgi:hypothetical protein
MEGGSVDIVEEPVFIFAGARGTGADETPGCGVSRDVPSAGDGRGPVCCARSEGTKTVAARSTAADNLDPICVEDLKRVVAMMFIALLLWAYVSLLL